jgi:esterase/lipase superfamily enzyme
MLAAPDIDVNVFREQLRKLSPSHFSVLVSSNDRALFLSRHLAGDRPRLGSLNPHNPSDKAILDHLGVGVYDISEDSVGLIGHATFGDAPAVVQQIGATIGAKRLKDSDVTAVLGDRPVSEKVMTQPLPPETGTAVPPPIAPAPSAAPTAATTAPGKDPATLH